MIELPERYEPQTLMYMDRQGNNSIFRFRFSLRSLFFAMTCCGLLLFLGLQRLAPRDYGRAARFGEFEMGAESIVKRNLLEHVQTLAQRSFQVDGYSVAPGRFHIQHEAPVNEDLSDVDYEVPDRFGHFQFAFSSQNWKVWAHSDARLTNRTGESIHSIGRVNLRRKRSSTDEPTLIVRVEFRTHCDWLRMPYAQEIGQQKCEEVLSRVCERFSAECQAEKLAKVRWE